MSITNKLKLKKEFENTIITKRHPKMGVLTVDTSTLLEKQYELYKSLGFDIFNDVCKYCEHVECECITEPKTSKTKKYKAVENKKK